MMYSDFAKLGLNGKFVVRDLWRQADISNIDTKSGQLNLIVAPHGVVLYKFMKVK
jgi:alpha-galactosidase